jgi:hypothetical protein
MKLRKHTCTAVLLVVALALLPVGNNAFAQYLQPPFMAPTPPSLCYGVFYLDAGAQYRNLQGVSFTIEPSEDIQRVFNTNVVAPTIQTGYQWSNYFDLFYGISWFNASNSMALSTIVFDPSISPVQNFTQDITISAEFTPIENRFGARSWAPLWGMGRWGAFLGASVIPTHFKIAGSTTDIGLGNSDPNLPAPIPPGAVLLAAPADQDNWKTLYGVFVGSDLSVGNTGYFLTGSIDYMWATSVNYDFEAVKASFSHSGWSAGLSFGFQF